MLRTMQFDLRLLLLGAAASVTAVGCSTSFRAKACQTDDDCSAGLVCLQSACAAGSTAPLRIGLSAPLSGPNQELGTEMKKGITLAFDEQNALGGVHGRPLELVFRDDQYQPTLAEQSVRQLLDVQDLVGAAPKCPTTATPVTAGQTPVSTNGLARGPNAVLALPGNVGTPTMVRTAPIAVETGTLFFAPFTGAKSILRDDAASPCNRFIFNVRASYAQEARATLEYFFKVGVPDAAHVLSFDQSDGYGQAGYDGLTAAYLAIRGVADPLRRFRYTRDDPASVPTQVAAVTKYLGQLLASDTAPHVVGIMMTDTYGTGTQFVTGVRNWQYATDAEQTATQKATRLTIVFSNVSFVGPNALAQRLHDAGNVATPGGPKPYTDGVLVSQVVPNYDGDNSDVVVQYRKRVEAAGTTASFTSLEAYVDARVFIAGLLAHKGAYTPEALVGTFERLPNLSLGLGAASGFSATNHNYSSSVWGTTLTADGKFQNRYFWSDGAALQLFE